MILEVADLRIVPERAAEFEQAAVRGVTLHIAPCKGFQSYQFQRCIETPGRFLLLIQWDSLEDHTIGFRNSPAFTEWRALVWPFFAQPPYTEHFQLVA